MRRSVFTTVLLVALGIAALAAGTGYFTANAQQKAETTEVKIDNFSFGPGTLTVTLGTTVTWTNRDDISHTVLSTDMAFKSKVLDTDEKFSFTFTFTFSKGGNLSLLLFHSPEDDRQGCGAVRDHERKSLRRASSAGTSPWPRLQNQMESFQESFPERNIAPCLEQFLQSSQIAASIAALSKTPHF
jgi:plastocyanin